MPYEFPNHYLRPDEIIDPDDLTAQISPAAELISGQLGAHNFSGSTNIRRTMQGKYAISRTHWTSLPGDPSFADTQGAAVNQICDGGYATMLSNSSSWSTLSSTSYDVTQPSRVWVSCFTQYVWRQWLAKKVTLPGGESASPQRPPFPGHLYQYGDWDDKQPTPFTGGIDHYPKRMYSAMVQFAVRVNGQLIDESITGSQNVDQKAVVPIKVEVERVGMGEDEDRSQFPGPSMQSTYQRAALGVAAHPARFGAVVDLQPGNNVIELVSRRLLDSRYQKYYGSRDSDNRIWVTAASLHCVEMPFGMHPSQGGRSINVPAFSDQETLSLSSMYDQRMGVLESGLQDISTRQVKPSTFRYEHLEHTVLNYGSRQLRARSDSGYTGFVYRNPRPETGLRGFLEGGATVNPSKPKLTWTFKDQRTGNFGWCMWAVRDYKAQEIQNADGTATDHDGPEIPWIDGLDPRTTSTSSGAHYEVVPNGNSQYEEERLAFACLNGDWVFKKGRRRHIIVTADVDVCYLAGDNSVQPFTEFEDSADWTIQTQVNKYTETETSAINSGIFAHFRLGFHLKGKPKDDWVLPLRSEAYVNQFCNWRVHDVKGKDNNFYRMATISNLSLQLVISRPWKDAQGSSWSANVAEANGVEDRSQTSDDLVIDGIALFVAGKENFRSEGPNVGLSGASISAILYDEGRDD
jgi:hypothetical protein